MVVAVLCTLFAMILYLEEVERQLYCAVSQEKDLEVAQHQHATMVLPKEDLSPVTCVAEDFHP